MSLSESGIHAGYRASTIEESARRCLATMLQPMPRAWPGRQAMVDITLQYVGYIALVCCGAFWAGLADGFQRRMVPVALACYMLFASTVAMSWFIEAVVSREDGARFVAIGGPPPRTIAVHAEPCGAGGVDLQLHVTTHVCRGLWSYRRVAHSRLPTDGYLDDGRLRRELETMLMGEGLIHAK
jgi:hypothetical protein